MAEASLLPKELVQPRKIPYDMQMKRHCAPETRQYVAEHLVGLRAQRRRRSDRGRTRRLLGDRVNNRIHLTASHERIQDHEAAVGARTSSLPSSARAAAEASVCDDVRHGGSPSKAQQHPVQAACATHAADEIQPQHSVHRHMRICRIRTCADPGVSKPVGLP